MGLGLGLGLVEDWPGAVDISYKSAGVSAGEGINEIIRTYLYLYLYLVLLFFFLVRLLYPIPASGIKLPVAILVGLLTHCPSCSFKSHSSNPRRRDRKLRATIPIKKHKPREGPAERDRHLSSTTSSLTFLERPNHSSSQQLHAVYIVLKSSFPCNMITFRAILQTLIMELGFSNARHTIMSSHGLLGPILDPVFMLLPSQ